MKRYPLSLFIFRRDLRLRDNTTLLQAHRESEQVLPVFIVDPRQCNRNSFKSNNAIRFMVQSLIDLSEQIEQRSGRLHILSGRPEEVLGELLEEYPIEAVFVNKDYTPFSRKRDRELERCCHQSGRKFISNHDALLNAPDEVLKQDGTPYTVFTPFCKSARKNTVPTAKAFRFDNFYSIVPGVKEFNLQKLMDCQLSPNPRVPGGRKSAQKLLRNMKRLKEYAIDRDLPGVEATSLLSAHLKFGTVSVREVYAAVVKQFGEEHAFLNQLYWRDFFTQIAWHFPHVFCGPFREKYAAVPWERDATLLKLWKNGMTGFPIVDAGMRELKQTGFMHNRVRMIVASFLTKDLQIHWKEGELHFARLLVDYDPAVNNGNWQWAASTGCDAQPYFRVFNPWRQQKRFDPDAAYIKRWVPELRDSPAALIHKLDEAPQASLKGYPAPVVDHAIERERAIERFQKL